jgi:hypothetical protein
MDAHQSSSTDDKTHRPLYDVDELIASLDCDKFHLTDRSAVSSDRNESTSKRTFLSSNSDEHQDALDQISPKKQMISSGTLGDRLQIAAARYKENGHLPFDDDYVELVRLMLYNSSLSNDEQRQLKERVRLT